MADIVTAVAGAVEEQIAATSEIARSIEVAAGASASVSHRIRDVRVAAEHTQATSSEVRGASDLLGQQTTALRASVDQFMVLIKT